MPWKDIIDCLRLREGANIEFVKNVESAEQIAKVIVSFANNSGGRIIVGIDNNNDHLLGSNISKGFIMNVIEKIDADLSINIEEIPRLNKTVLIIKVPNGSNKPYSYRNKYYFRTETTNKKATKDEIYKLVGEKKEIELNKRQEKAIKHLKENKEITNRTYRELYKVSHKTAHIELTGLLNMNLIKKVGQGRSTCYVIK